MWQYNPIIKRPNSLAHTNQPCRLICSMATLHAFALSWLSDQPPLKFQPNPLVLLLCCWFTLRPGDMREWFTKGLMFNLRGKMIERPGIISSLVRKHSIQNKQFLVKSIFRSKQYQKTMPFLILHKIFMMFWGKISLNCCWHLCLPSV